MIKPGQIWGEEIVKKLNQSDIILMLISASFFNSKYIRTVELKLAKDRHDKGRVRLIPIIARECYWQDDPIVSKLQVLPDGDKAIDSKVNWQSEDQPYTEIVKGIVSIFNEIKPEKEKIPNPKVSSTMRKTADPPIDINSEREETVIHDRKKPDNGGKKPPKTVYYAIGLVFLLALSLVKFFIDYQKRSSEEVRITLAVSNKLAEVRAKLARACTEKVMSEAKVRYTQWRQSPKTKPKNIHEDQKKEDTTDPLPEVNVKINIIHPPNTTVERIDFDPRVPHTIGSESTTVTVIRNEQYKATFYFANGIQPRTIYFNSQNYQIVLR
jgi:hypothetical protein